MFFLVVVATDKILILFFLLYLHVVDEYSQSTGLLGLKYF